MDNVVHLFYMGFCVAMFCLGVSLLMMANREITSMQDKLYEIVTDNVMVGVK